jgi:hypothetical protein
MGKGKNAYIFMVGKHGKRDHLEDLGIDERI